MFSYADQKRQIAVNILKGVFQRFFLTYKGISRIFTLKCLFYSKYNFRY